jgi:secondary thiamine-phosphate synthase enzyme
MQIVTRSLEFSTNGNNHIIDITNMVQDLIKNTYLKEGNVLLSAVGSTTGITTLEFEPGLVKKDVNDMFENFAPYGKNYLHNQTWGDNNGASHLRSMLTGTSLTLPFVKQKLILGTWQQIVFIDFDTRPRDRKVIVQCMGV